MKADQFGTASEQLRFKDNWRLAEKQKPGHLSARCDNCAGSESGKGKSLQSLSCVRNDYSTKPNAVCDLHSFSLRGGIAVALIARAAGPNERD